MTQRSGSAKRVWKRILAVLEDPKNLNVVHLSTLGARQVPSSRPVLLRYLKSFGRLYVCTNMKFPKWREVRRHPHVAVSGYFERKHRVIRLQARVVLHLPGTEFVQLAWEDLPMIQKKRYWAMVGKPATVDLRQVAPIFGCMELRPYRWIVDETGPDHWIAHRQRGVGGLGD